MLTLQTLVALLTVFVSVIASNAQCIVNDLGDVKLKLCRVKANVDSFHSHIIGDAVPLGHLQRRVNELERSMRRTIDDLDCQCGVFSAEDTQAVLVSFEEIKQPVRDTLESINCKKPQFDHTIFGIPASGVVRSDVKSIKYNLDEFFCTLKKKVDKSYIPTITDSQTEADKAFCRTLAIYSKSGNNDCCGCCCC